MVPLSTFYQNSTNHPIFWEEWQPCIAVMWHYAKTPQSTTKNIFLTILRIFYFCRYKVLSPKHFLAKSYQSFHFFMEGFFGRNGNPALRLCGIMQKHHGILVDF